VRILHVDKFLRRQGGAAGYMLDVAALQRGEGHEVEFFAMAHPGNEPATYEAMFPRLVELEPPPPTITGRLDATATMLWSARAARAMAAVADAFRPDVVHLHNIYHQLSPSILRPLRKRGIAVVLTAHDYKLVCPSYRMLDGEQLCEACVSGSALNAARRRCKDGSLGASAVLAVESSLHRAMRAYGPVHRFIAPSRFLAGQLARGGIAPERIRQLNNFVDTSTIPARAGTGTGFLSVGRLSPEKGVDTLIEAVGLTPGAHLVVAGDGPERSRLEALAGRVAPGRVRFAGHVSPAEVAALNAGARAAVLAARWYENMPLSVLETQAAAVPLIVTALGGLPELVRDGHSGLVVPPNDAPALAAALQRLQADPELAATLGRQGRQSALANHDPGAHLQALEGIYVEALAAADRPDRAAVPRR
jgi:glycosyltransferase involved in cell wall biosynthesis